MPIHLVLTNPCWIGITYLVYNRLLVLFAGGDRIRQADIEWEEDEGLTWRVEGLQSHRGLEVQVEYVVT